MTQADETTNEMASAPALAHLSPAQLRATASAVRPSPRQVAWAQRELTAFLHVGMNTVTGREWGTGWEDPAAFTLPRADCRQWTRTLAGAGFRAVVLTAKHHDGFCLWPSRHTRHSVAASPWRGGRGDLVRELVDAARADGLAVGVYLSPADLHQRHVEGRYANGSPRRLVQIPTLVPGDDRRGAHGDGSLPVFEADVDDYNRYYLDQLYELLTEYGDVDEVWLDGADPEPGPEGQRQVYDRAAWYRLIRLLSPGAAIFGGPDARWVGNESGVARTTEWSVVATVGGPLETTGTLADSEQAPDLGSPTALARGDALAWYPAEVAVSIRPGWFHHSEQDDAVKGAEQLLDLYESSVGRNAVLLLNVPPTREGLLHPADVAALTNFGERRREVYEHGRLAVRVERVSGEVTAWVDDDAEGAGAAARPVDVVVLTEPLESGQQVEAFTIEVLGRQHGQGPGWRTVAEGTTVGHHRVLRLKRQRDIAAVRVRVTAARGPACVVVSLHHDPRALERAVAPPVLLDAVRNSTTTTVDHDRARGQVGPSRLSLSVAALAAAGVVPGGDVAVGGFTFGWPLVSPGAPDAVLPRGQRLALSGRGTRLGLLWVSTGDGLPGYAQVRYRGGDATEVAVGRYRPSDAGSGADGDVIVTTGAGGEPFPVAEHSLRAALPGAVLHTGDGPPWLLVQEVPLLDDELVELSLPVVPFESGTHLVAVSVAGSVEASVAGAGSDTGAGR